MNKPLFAVDTSTAGCNEPESNGLYALGIGSSMSAVSTVSWISILFSVSRFCSWPYSSMTEIFANTGY